MGKQFISVEADIKNAQNALSGTKKSLKAISKKALGVIGRGTVKAIKTAIKGSGLKKRTGELLKSYRQKVKKDGSSMTVFPKALNGEKSIFPKIMALSYGSEKRNLKALGFVQKGSEYVEKGNYSEEIDKMVKKELEKYWGK